jgi:hypothetical protein
MILQVVDIVLMWMNRCRANPPNKPAVFRGSGRLEEICLVSCRKEEKHIYQTNCRKNHPCSRPSEKPSTSAHIYSKQSSPCLYFGQSSLRLSYPLRGASLVNSPLLSIRNSYIGSGKESGPRDHSWTREVPFFLLPSSSVETLSSR